MYKDIVVHLEPSEASRTRLAAAAEVTARFGARLTGLYVVGPDPTPVYAGDPMGGGAVAAAQLEALSEANPFVQHAEEIERAFRAVADAHHLLARWERVDGPIAPLVSRYARTADLAVVGRDARAEPDLSVPGLAGEAVLHCGRPVLVMPSEGHWSRVGSRALVAWNGSRESARALHDALPFLVGAEQVTVVTVAEGSPSAALGIDVIDHLRRHGVAAQLMQPPREVDVGDELLARGAELACNLLVMGAYRHSRLRELVFGGTTRHLLAHPTLPILMSH